jgi:poly-beta-1,6-N-acetyl-D-glucosamine synthase
LLINVNVIYKVFFFCQVFFYLSAFFSLFLQRLNMKLGMFGFPLYFCTLNLAALISMVNLLLGKSIIKWETQR